MVKLRPLRPRLLVSFGAALRAVSAEDLALVLCAARVARTVAALLLSLLLLFVLGLLLAGAALADAPPGASAAQRELRARGAPAPASWIAQVQREVARSERHFSQRADGAWSAPNRAHDLRTIVTSSGAEIVSRTAGAALFRLTLSLARFGRTDRLAPAAPAVGVSAHEERVVLAREGLLEWYVNGPRGLEHGFTLELRPPGDRLLALDLALGGSAGAAATADGQAVLFWDAQGGRRARYAELAVADAAGAQLPARLVVLPGFLRIEVDDADAAYPLVIDPLLTSATWSVEGDQDGANFGQSVATAGDVNGDGYSDVVVGAPYFDGGEQDEGRAFVFHGAPGGPATTPSWTAESNQAGARFGSAVGAAGDVNGDGFGDVIVGAPRFDNEDVDEGRAYVYHGGGAGLSAAPAWTAEGDAYWTEFGAAVGTAGDVNGDGYADAIVGAPYYGDDGAGRAFVYGGGPSGLAATAAWSVAGDQAWCSFGRSAGTAGDVNADGYSDVIVGAPEYDNDLTDEGRAYVHLGGPAGLAATAIWTAEGDQEQAYFGWSAGTAGDVNGDGYADVVLGAWEWDDANVGWDVGRAWVFHGGAGGVSATPAWTAEGQRDSAWLGDAVATAGDVNGDGYADIVVGASGDGAAATGCVHLYEGGPAGLPSSPSWTGAGDQGSAEFGSAVGPAGDVDGDGYSDVIVGAHYFDNSQTNAGRAQVFFGGASGLAAAPGWSAAGGQESAQLGWAAAAAGDVNGDGYSDVIVGAPGFDGGQADEGRTLVFHGGAAGLGSSPAWVADGEQAAAQFGYAVASAGDVDGDGFSDVIVGAPFYDGGVTDEGRAFVFRGGAQGLAASAVWTADGGQASAYFGWSAASAGDVDGDGRCDVIVGARYYDNGQIDEGRASLYLGGAGGPALAPAWTAEGDQDYAQFGYTVASAGDVDGDGFSDAIVGAPGFDGEHNNAGRAFLYRGAAEGLSALPSWTATGDQPAAELGSAVASAGDVNGDGFADVVVGARSYDNGQTDEGQALVHLGGAAGLATAPAWIAEGNQASALFGGALASAGDVNGDGFSDVIVGAAGYDVGVADEGAAFVYLGSAAGLAAIPAWTTTGGQAGAHLGAAVASTGDVNGDGFADVLVGAPGAGAGFAGEGRALVFGGGGGGGLARTPRQARSDQTALIALLGVSDAPDAFRLRLKGRTPAGRGRVRMEYEATTLAAPFGGAPPVRTASVDTGAPGPGGSVHDGFDELASGLTQGAHKWRARLASDDPFFPRSPWIGAAGNAITATDLRTCTLAVWRRDADGDGRGDPSVTQSSCTSPGAGWVQDATDCNDADANAWATPGEVRSLLLAADRETLSWTAPAAPGATTIVYDVLRSSVAGDFVGAATCVESNDGADRAATDATKPAAGAALHYLVRAENSCPAGRGPLGADSDGVPRAGRDCP